MEPENGSDDHEIDILHVNEWPADEIVNLYKAGSWWKDSYDPSGIDDLIKGSFDFVVALDREEKRAVGMGRMISDGVSDGYIQDVVVFPDKRGLGIGSGIVNALVKKGTESGLVWIGLIAEKGSEEFYERLDFRTFKGQPMIFGEEG